MEGDDLDDGIENVSSKAVSRLVIDEGSILKKEH